MRREYGRGNTRKTAGSQDEQAVHTTTTSIMDEQREMEKAIEDKAGKTLRHGDRKMRTGRACGGDGRKMIDR